MKVTRRDILAGLVSLPFVNSSFIKNSAMCEEKKIEDEKLIVAGETAKKITIPYRGKDTDIFVLSNVIGLVLQPQIDRDKVLKALNKEQPEEKKFTEWLHKSFNGIEKRGIMLVKTLRDPMPNFASKIKEANISEAVESIGRVVYVSKESLFTASILLDEIIVDLKPGSSKNQLADFSVEQGLKIVRGDRFISNRYYLRPEKNYTDPLNVIEKAKKYKSFEHILPESIKFSWSTPIEHPR